MSGAPPVLNKWGEAGKAAPLTNMGSAIAVFPMWSWAPTVVTVPDGLDPVVSCQLLRDPRSGVRAPPAQLLTQVIGAHAEAKAAQ